MKWLAGFLALFIGSAHAQVITPAPTPYKLLYVTGTSVGNGADTTVDTLQTFTMAAGQLANVGDVIRVYANGTVASSTDVKLANVTFGGQIIGTQTISTTGVTKWSIELWIIKTASNTQTRLVTGSIGGSPNIGTSSGPISITDTSPITIAITGQNQTNAVAGSVTCAGVVIEYMHQ